MVSLLQEGKARQGKTILRERNMLTRKSNSQNRSLGTATQVKGHLQWNFTRQSKSLNSEMGNMSKANFSVGGGGEYRRIEEIIKLNEKQLIRPKIHLINIKTCI